MDHNPNPLADLRTAIEVLAAHEHPGAVRVAWWLDLWLCRGGDFAAAVGLGSNWHSTLRQRQRNLALHALAQRHFPQLTGRPLADAIADAALRYETTRWPGDRDARVRPEGASGLLYDILTLGPMPRADTLRKCIYRGLKAVENPHLGRDCG